MAGSWVKIPGGYKLIEDLDVGDIVSSYEFGSKDTLSEAQVLKILRTKSTTAVQLFVGSTCVLTTPMQRFYSLGKGWVDVSHLGDDQILFAPKGGRQALRKEDVHGDFEQITITVSGTHVFFVSKEDLLVHNSPVEIFGDIVKVVAPNISAPGFSVLVTMGMLLFTMFKKGVQHNEEIRIRELAEQEAKKREAARQEFLRRQAP